MRIGAHADALAPAHGGEDRALGEYFGVGADGDFQVLRPESIGDQRLLEAHRRGRAGGDAAQFGADALHQRGADGARAGGVAAGALLDHPFHRGDGKGHAACLDALQVDGREQTRGGRRRMVFPGGRQAQFGERPQRRSRRQLVGLEAVEQLGYGGSRGRQVVDHAPLQ